MRTGRRCMKRCRTVCRQSRASMAIPLEAREAGGDPEERDLCRRVSTTIYAYESDLLLLQSLQRAEVPVWVIGFDRDPDAAVAGCQGDPAAICMAADTLIAVSAKRIRA